MFDPTVGRWFEEDPEGLDAGPNLYEYVNNTPTSATDPSGLFLLPAAGTPPGSLEFQSHEPPRPIGNPQPAVAPPPRPVMRDRLDAVGTFSLSAVDVGDVSLGKFGAFAWKIHWVVTGPKRKEGSGSGKGGIILQHVTISGNASDAGNKPIRMVNDKTVVSGISSQ